MLIFYRFVYDAGVHIYFLGIYLARFFNPKAKKSYQGRKNLFLKLEASLNELDRSKPRIWVHCASLGEFEQARPVIEALKSADSYQIILTFFSPSGYEIRKDYPAADIVTYLPKDTPSRAKRFVQLINPDTAIFVKYEFWYHFLYHLHLKKCPILLISAIFQKGDIFFKWYGKIYRQMLRFFNTIYVQDQNSVKLLKPLKLRKVVKSGDTRVERVYQLTKSPKKLKYIDQFKDDHIVFIGGSTYKQEEQFIKKFMDRFQDRSIKYIIAPHEVASKNIARLKSLLKPFDPLCYSTVQSAKNLSPTDVLIIDSIGLLAHLYQYGDICMIGGGFGSSIHNILEPAAFGLPVIFGPNHQGFKEASDLIRLKGAFSIRSYTAFENQALELIDNKKSYREASEACRNYIKQNIGATEQIIEKIKQLNGI